MKSKVRNYAFLLMAIVMVVVSTLTIKVNAAGEQKGSLTIICHEQKNGDTENSTPLEGVGYNIYKVDESVETTDEAVTWLKIPGNSGNRKTGKTNSEGKIIFSDLELGKYFVEVNPTTPAGVEKFEHFLVEIPMSNVTGDGLNYDVTVEPKIQSVYGNLELSKVDMDNKPISEVDFNVQYLYKYAVTPATGGITAGAVDSGEWMDCDNVTLTTNEEGKITLNNLPRKINGIDVVYRLVETSAPNGYIMDNYTLSRFCFYVDENGQVVTNYNEPITGLDDGDIDKLPEYGKKYVKNVTQQENLTSVTYANEKVTLTKKVKDRNSNWVDSASWGKDDKIDFEIKVSIPDMFDIDSGSHPAIDLNYLLKFNLKDTLPEGLILDEESLSITGNDGNNGGHHTISDDKKNIDVVLNCLCSEITISYTAHLDMKNAVIGGLGNINTVTLEYPNNIPQEIINDVISPETGKLTDTAEVHTGALKIEKVDKKNVELKLAGAKFKIATSKENAKAGIFVQDNNSNDIEVITDVNGIADIKGLAYEDNGDDSTYWLVETQAPTYTTTVNGEEVTKSYNLLLNPLEVKVGKTTYDTAVQVKNSKGFTLPETGGIGIILFVIVGISIMTIAVIKSKKENKELVK